MTFRHHPWHKPYKIMQNLLLTKLPLTLHTWGISCQVTGIRSWCYSIFSLCVICQVNDRFQYFGTSSRHWTIQKCTLNMFWDLDTPVPNSLDRKTLLKWNIGIQTHACASLRICWQYTKCRTIMSDHTILIPPIF
jgi:hypothetical protein